MRKNKDVGNNKKRNKSILYFIRQKTFGKTKIFHKHMTEKKIIVSKTMRYFTIGDIDKADKLLYVLHGYGQLASYFIKSFDKISDSYFVVAPEGMHRFYLKGTSGRVGASWMTKEAREIDIDENTKNLALLNQQIFRKKNIQKKNNTRIFSGWSNRC